MAAHLDSAARWAVLTLVVIPVVYSLADALKRRMGRGGAPPAADNATSLLPSAVGEDPAPAMA